MLSVLATGSVLLRPLRQLHPLPQQPRSARLVACADSDFHALPPAQKRDVAAELYAEVSCATSEIAADAAPPTPMRPLVALTVSEDGGLTLVGEHIQNITSGLPPTRAHPRYRCHAPARNTARRTIPPLTVYSRSLSAGNMAGLTWMRPLAIRSHRNAPGASSDTSDGSTSSDAASPERVIDSSLHVFANAGRHMPATFVPTRLVRPAACPDALEVRLLQGVAENPDDEDEGDAEAHIAHDSARLQRFLSHLADEPK